MSFPSNLRKANCKSIFEYGILVLNTCNSDLKSLLTLEAKQLYDNGKIPMGDPSKVDLPPDTPSRPLNVTTLPPSQMPKRGKAGTLKNRIALIHAFCHIESYAIDLSWDIMLRYCPSEKYRSITMKTSKKIDQLIECFKTNNFDIFDINLNKQQNEINHTLILPNEFYEDWLRIAAEEALHYNLWAKRLKELGSFYGALPGHNGLWMSAINTNKCILDRLTIVHMVLEGRGLDVTPFSMEKLKKVKDEKSLQLLKIIYKDEITHVKSGLRWFKYVCNQLNIENMIHKFHAIVRNKFDGNLKPPFNDKAREEAGFTKEWYMPLSFD
eukprot:213421_1